MVRQRQKSAYWTPVVSSKQSDLVRRPVMATAAVQVVNLHVWYAQAHVLDGVSLHAMPGEIVALLGRKGSGRSMTLRAIFGQTQGRKGSVQVIGQETICH